jgi:acetyl esterase
MRRWFEMIASGQLIRRVVLDAGLHSLAAGLDFLPRMRQRMENCLLIENLEYGQRGGEQLLLDIVKPKSEGPHPVLMYFHGGGFAMASKRTHRGLAAAYASQGYLVCNVDYRLAPKHPFPAALEDACAAWLWMLDHVHEYGGDPLRTCVAGESAGGNLALAVTLACCMARPEPFAAPLFKRDLRPTAALIYCGFLQVSAPERYNRPGISKLARKVAADAAASYLGQSTTRSTPENAMADPLCIVESWTQAPSMPPVFIAAGLADPVVQDSQRLETALTRLKSPQSTHYYPGETHAFHVMFWRKQAIRCWKDSFEFLRQHLPPNQ